MKIGRVVGKLSLSKVHPSLVGRRWVLALPMNLAALAGRIESRDEEIIAVDELGATEGTTIGIADGREAAAPFEPARKPVDAYTACLLDEIRIDRVEVEKLLGV
jgi:ethanolamine utilization protein EutN